MRRPFAPAVVLLAALCGCTSISERRAQIITLDAQWRSGTMEEGSFEEMVDDIRIVGAQSKSDEGRLAAVPELLRLVVAKNPSSWVRREALLAAWQLSSALPDPSPVREDTLDKAEFNKRTTRLEEIVLQQGDVDNPEALELASWLGSVRAPYEEVELSISVAEVVVSQSLWRTDALGQAFRDNMAGSLQHALALVTLRASTDTYPVVREAALASVRHLHPDAALALVAGVLSRETDSAVLLAALDSMAVLAPRLDPEELRTVLEPLRASTDVAVRAQIRSLLGPAAG
ncbi:MAG TPA: hypothetical protein VFY71_04265 [Planctomycetota bacterium]|nr:hypothetical protein [Planctomycetota bacterium]